MEEHLQQRLPGVHFSGELLNPDNGIAELGPRLAAALPPQCASLLEAGATPLEVCRAALGCGAAEALAISWLLHHDAWFARLYASVPADCYKFLHPDFPAVALQWAVNFIVAEQPASDQMSRQKWFIDLREYALAVDPHGTRVVLHQGLVAQEPSGPVFSYKELLSAANLSLPKHGNRPHWFGDLATWTAQLGRALPRQQRVWAVHKIEGQQVVMVGCQDPDIQQIYDVPTMVNDLPVILYHWAGPGSAVLPVNSRWNLSSAQAREINSALAEHANHYFASNKDVIALTGGYRSRGGAVNFQEPCVVAFVRGKKDRCCRPKPNHVARLCGKYSVDVEEAPAEPQAYRERLSESYNDNSCSAFLERAADAADNDRLFIGETTYKRCANFKQINKSQGTLGMFAETLAQPPLLVAVTAGHCICLDDSTPGQFVCKRFTIAKYDPPLALEEDSFAIYDEEVYLQFDGLTLATDDCASIKDQLQACHFLAGRKLPVTLHAQSCVKISAGAELVAADLRDLVTRGGVRLRDVIARVDTENVDRTPSQMDTIDYGYWILRGKTHENIDAATVGTAEDWDEVGRPPIHLSDQTTDVVDAAHYFKYGSTTRLTVGKLAGTYIYFRGQQLPRLKISHLSERPVPFAARGDSGSCVFDMNGRVVGLLIQYWISPHDFAVCVPIAEVLARLNIKLLA